jgi:enoyl-CoA hydratase/carnithine racemase
MIECIKDGALWTLRINRPEKANSLTPDMLEALCDHAEAAKGHARVMVLTGTGKVFSAGADLDAAKAGLATSPLWERLSSAVASFDGLSIAALNGTLAGGAMGMALACDLRLAVPGAKFFYPVMQLGYLPQPSDPGRLAALVGPARAKLILMGAQKLTAPEALSFGLIDRIVEADDMQAAIEDITAAPLAAPLPILHGIKAMIP